MVEDSEDDAALVLHELRRAGRKIEAERVDAAAPMRRALTTSRWDVVLSDSSMPQFSALAALGVLKELDLDLPFIVVSGTIGDEAAVDLMRHGAHDYLLKDKLARLGPAIDRELREREVRADRKRMIDELRVSEERYRRIIETTNEGVWIVDGDATTSFLNHRMAVMLGYTIEEIGRRSMFDFIETGARDDTSRNLAKRRDGISDQSEMTFVCKDGTSLNALVDSTPIFGQLGKFEGVLNMVIDVTAQKRAELALRSSEDQLRQAQKMEAVGRLAGGVAHDFNNVLSVILSCADFISEDIAPKDPIHADLEEIRKAALRAAALTRQLLLFSRQEVIEPKVLGVAALLGDLVKMLPRLLGEDIDLMFVPDATTGRILADAGQIEQVVMNLVVNARDAMPTGGKLTIESVNVDLSEDYARDHLGTKAGPHVMIAVTDSGTGMDPATQRRIFEPFFTTKGVGKGTGLGLSTVFGIVQQSRGSLWVYSEPGIGTTFKVYFPRVDAEVDVTKVLPAATAMRGTETILLVEDEGQVRAAALGILRRSGYHVLEASNAGEALLHAESPGQIDLLLSDVVMPQMSGPELARRLSKLRPAMKILCMSGYTDDSIVRHGVLDGNLPYLQKPFTRETLTRKVRLVLDAPSPVRTP
jgi:two-component system cell cycle sensor histidine kinase/response regulator CckA